MTKAVKIDVLMLDDRGTGTIDGMTRSDRLKIIDDRAGNKATIITSQLPVEHYLIA